MLTVEGLAGANGELHPVQKAFVDELAPQCGFCTPGQVMSAVALLKHNPKPTRDQARLPCREISVAAAPTTTTSMA